MMAAWRSWVDYFCYYNKLKRESGRRVASPKVWKIQNASVIILKPAMNYGIHGSQVDRAQIRIHGYTD